MNGKVFRLLVIAPDGTRADERVTSVILPAYDGKFGIKSRLYPINILLTDGDVTFTREDGTKDSVHIPGGIADVCGDVTVVIG